MPSRTSARSPLGEYRLPSSDATLLGRLVAGPVRIERDCRDCAQRGCEPSACLAAQQFEGAVDTLRALERHGLVSVWLRGYYASTPGAPACVRATLTDAGRELARVLVARADEAALPVELPPARTEQAPVRADAPPEPAPRPVRAPAAAALPQGLVGTTRTTRPFDSSVTR